MRPRKTILVEGEQSLDGDDTRPYSLKRYIIDAGVVKDRLENVDDRVGSPLTG